MFKPCLPCHLSCHYWGTCRFCDISVFLTGWYWFLLIYWPSPLQNRVLLFSPILFISHICIFFSPLSICSYFNEVSRCIRGKLLCSICQLKLEIPSVSSLLNAYKFYYIWFKTTFTILSHFMRWSLSFCVSLFMFPYLSFFLSSMYIPIHFFILFLQA